MRNVISKDGTPIEFDQVGERSPLVLVGGVLGDRSQHAALTALLASHFMVFNYDRRGHGESGDTPPYAVEREIEDLDALLNEAGGSAFVYGTSGCAVLALSAAAAGLASKIRRLALWEPSFIVDESRPPVPQDYKEQLISLLREGGGPLKRRWRTPLSPTLPSWVTSRFPKSGSPPSPSPRSSLKVEKPCGSATQRKRQPPRCPMPG